MTTALREKFQLSIDQRRFFGQNGYLVVDGLLSPEELAELDRHSSDLAENKVDLSHAQIPSWLEEKSQQVKGTSPQDIEDKYFRFIQFHEHLEIHERYMLHPRVLDVLEVLIGPDVMGMQSMLFLKPPGQPGQAYHQDSHYIKTAPDTLCGAWMAIDDADEDNGCMGFIPGSNHEPIYEEVAQPENTNDFKEGLSETQGVDSNREVLAPVKAGGVVFFHGHLLHRSRRNSTKDRFRRVYVCHYANARSYTEWGGGNESQILARGSTHLPFARTRFIDFDPEPIG
jgi:phytanoyl-CoA hydroxylase